MTEINIEDIINMAGNNVYDTEYSCKITVSCKDTTHKMFVELKQRLKQMGINTTNEQLFEYMVVELYNSNLKQLT